MRSRKCNCNKTHCEAFVAQLLLKGIASIQLKDDVRKLS